MIDTQITENLLQRASKGDASVLRSVELKSIFDELKLLQGEDRAKHGQAANE